MEPRPEIQREQQEIKHRIQEARMISDSNKRKEIAAAEISKSARIERSEDFRREVDAIEKRLVGGDVRCVSETVKVDSIRKKKKKLRMLKPKKNKSKYCFLRWKLTMFLFLNVFFISFLIIFLI